MTHSLLSPLHELLLLYSPTVTVVRLIGLLTTTSGVISTDSDADDSFTSSSMYSANASSVAVPSTAAHVAGPGAARYALTRSCSGLRLSHSAGTTGRT